MTNIDWVVLTTYLIGIIGLGVWLARRQQSTDDYFLGGRKMGPTVIAISLAANQVSAISLVSAPAFVALKTGGGIKWLQFEFAVPVSMIAIMFLLVPVFRQLSGSSVYEYAERRFGKRTRFTLSALFMFSRGLSTSVILYTSALVLSVIMDLPIVTTMIIMAIVSIAYTTIGGIMADVYSDILQLIILYGGVLVALIVSISILGKDFSSISIDPARLNSIDFSHHGFGDGQTFAFWPMIIGCIFLYVGYYGCDQSQAQRLLATPDVRQAQNALMINGLIRFPIVLTYIIFGVVLAAFIQSQPDFATKIQDKNPDYLVPTFMINYLPVGVVGLVMAGLFAASMSSIDSAFNSLSAVTVSDFVLKFRPDIAQKPLKMLRLSKLITLFWGILCAGGAYFVARSSSTVIEIVNMIGSAFSGPILATFLAGILFRSITGSAIITGIIAGTTLNFLLGQYVPSISWLWWGPIGFCTTLCISLIYSKISTTASPVSVDWTLKGILKKHPEKKSWLRDKRVYALLVYTFVIIIISIIVSRVLHLIPG
ncbi:sodium:solute symporter family transporter [Candidatus Scalindua japonica]|uniref:sodium:solute symporter family transporter n=1 Tax=Candidatus Scalindua japonica TaxID=1284222 RepID=UPI000BDF2AE7|nr:sodium/solute symporter [Candidatus Scalindua japonica]